MTSTNRSEASVPPDLFFLIPGRLETRTGGYEYDRQIIAALTARGWTVSVESLGDSFPCPTDEALAHADRVLEAVPEGGRVLIDGLALGAMPDQVARVRDRLRVVGLVHHPLADETGLDASASARLLASERKALASVATVVVTSTRTAERLATAYDVARDRLLVVEPGTVRVPAARGSGDSTVHLLCVASFSPRKGHEVLVRALAQLVNQAWTLTCVGGLDIDPPTVARLRALIADSSLDGRIRLQGEADADRVAEYYDRCDVFVLPTLYEGYGMVVAEALARGLPVISTPTGAIAELVGGDAGLLVEPGHVAGWVDALRRIFDPVERGRLAAGARARRERLPTWEEAADRLAGALVVVGGHRRRG